MNTTKIYAIGLMSGTSLDGIDLVYVRFSSDDRINFEIIHAETVPYSKEWKQMLQNAIFSSDKEMQDLDKMYGKHLGQITNNFIYNYKIKEIDFVASHGHTILHQPEKGITLQIGDGKLIAEITKQKVICDFRTQDVKLGGQGAPLVPIGDELLFSEYDFCINLGGFSNISFRRNEERIAFDICPVNIVLNYYANKIGLEFDESGKIASEGKLNQQLLDSLNELNYYQQNPPKSLGLEWVQKEIFPLIDGLEKDIPTILRTFVEHIAIQIGILILHNSSVLVTGGGVFNQFLIKRIEFYASIKIEIPNKKLVNFKEALVFAFLGLLRNNNQINCLKSVTGASENHSSGQIFNP
jgi:anhydro-N-acetylmuramic acid kinase